MEKGSRLSIDASNRDAILKNDYPHLNIEQHQAVEMLCDTGSCHVLVGRAGSGKTTTLKAVVELHQQAGFKVLGMSLSASAADNLERESGCYSETIAFYVDKWQRLEEAAQAFWSIHPSSQHNAIEGRFQSLRAYALSDKHLLIVDEAGMVGTRQWQAILGEAEKSGAKVIAVGDDNQFKAIEAGDFFRKLLEHAQEKNVLCELNEILRQKEGWMQQASTDLAELRTYQALSDYEQRGHIRAYDADKASQIVGAYLQRQHANPEQSSLLLASTRAQCQHLNDEMRALLKNQGRLSYDEITVNERSFAIGDNIIFLKNDRNRKIECFDPETGEIRDFQVKNNTLGKIVELRDLQPKTRTGSEKPYAPVYQLTVEIDKQTSARFLVQDYSHIDHGYCITLHKAQGRTVDWAMIVASSNMDAHASYVGLTRHRQDVTLYYDPKTFGDFKGLQRSLSRVSNKDLCLDYTITAEHQGVWENVQEYKLLGQDLATMAREQNWQAYNSLKAERSSLGQIILSDWQAHWHYVRQAGLSKESMEIACGLKARPLSLGEQEAYLRVQNYGRKAFDARLLWKEISHSHPGKHCVDHPRYEAFTTLRQERNLLASEIIQNRPLHREFIQALDKDLGVGWKTIQSQARQDTAFAVGKIASRKLEISALIHPAYQNDDRQRPFVRIEADRIKQELNESISNLARDLLGEPQHRSGREWRYGNKGSISISIAGAKQGLYADFERGSYGGGLKLIQDKLDLDHKAAFKWAIGWLGYDRVTDKSPTHKVPVQRAMLEPRAWVPTFPISEQAQCSPGIQQCLNYQLNKWDRKEIARYAYKDADGNLLGYAVRLEDKQGNKVVLPLTYCQSPDGKQRQWRWQGFGNDRPLYGLDRLAAFKDKPVLVVEGEKTADAAQSLLPDYVVVSWAGGASAHAKTDWAPLLGRAITLWPDNDMAGLKAMAKIESQLDMLHQKQERNAQISVVSLPINTPEKWDLADAKPLGWSEKTIRSLLQPEKTLSVSNNHAFVQETLQKYSLEKPRQLSDHAFITQAENLHDQMLKWHQFLNSTVTMDENKHLLEKAILAAVLQPEAKREYCFLSTPLEAKLRSEDIALITAGRMQEQPEASSSRKALLKEGAKLHDNQSGKQLENFVAEYQKLYPDASRYQLELLANQQIQCWNMIKKDLPQAAEQTLLSHAKSFESLQQQGKVAQEIQKIIELPTTVASKENEKIFHKLLEKQFMEIAREEKFGDNSVGKLNPETLLEKSARASEQIQTTLVQERERALTIKEQERLLIKETEKER